MRFLLAPVFVFALLLQTVYPSVECGVAVGCCCAAETQKNADESGDCCGLPAQAASAAGVCHSLAGPAATDSSDCPCCEQTPDHAVPVVALADRELDALFNFEAATLLPLPAAAAVAKSQYCPPTDDLTRPGRHQRCHLLDCVWLL